MATKQVYAIKDFKYGTRMMRAGDAVEMTAPHQRLYHALGAISHSKPRAAAPKAVEAPAETPKKAAPRKTTRKRAAKKNA